MSSLRLPSLARFFFFVLLLATFIILILAHVGPSEKDLQKGFALFTANADFDQQPTPTTTYVRAGLYQGCVYQYNFVSGKWTNSCSSWPDATGIINNFLNPQTTASALINGELGLKVAALASTSLVMTILALIAAAVPGFTGGLVAVVLAIIASCFSIAAAALNAVFTVRNVTRLRMLFDSTTILKGTAGQSGKATYFLIAAAALSIVAMLAGLFAMHDERVRRLRVEQAMASEENSLMQEKSKA